MIVAPNGSTATYDAKRTTEAYADIKAIADNCSCPGCRNYRAAWRPDCFEPSLLAACKDMGIAPANAFETTAYGLRSDLVEYTGHLPFFGEVTRSEPFKVDFYPWFFEPGPPDGTARFAEGLSTIWFYVELPWVLSEAYPYGPNFAGEPGLRGRRLPNTPGRNLQYRSLPCRRWVEQRQFAEREY